MIFFHEFLFKKMVIKIKLRMITKSHAADPEIKFRTKSISKPYSHATATPPAWESMQKFCLKYFQTSQ